MKKLVVFAMCVLFASLLCTGIHASDDDVYYYCCGAEGEHGTNVKWAFDASSGTLTLTGKGEMMRHGYYADGMAEPWWDYSSQIKHVVIGEEIVNVGLAMFSGLENLESVSLPSSITVIEGCAFTYCRKLTRINIPDGVTHIGDSAFYYCALPSVEIPDSVVTIGGSAFYACHALESVVIGDGVEEICTDAFADCTALVSVDFGSGVETIGNMAFSGSALRSVDIPDSVRVIGNSAFTYCDSLTHITIPAGVEKVEYGAFSGCESLARVTILGDTEIGGSAFDNCYAITRIDILGSPCIGRYAFWRARASELHIDSIAEWCAVKMEDSTAIPMTSGVTHLYLGGEIVEELVVPEGVREIGCFLFCYNTDLTSVSLPSTLERIGRYAFYSADGISSLTIPDGVREIGEYAFDGCLALECLDFGSGIETVGRAAFGSCPSLERVNITDLEAFCYVSFESADSNPTCNYYAQLYLGGEAITDLVIPESVTEIGAYAFCYSGLIESVTLHDGVTSIGTEAFYACSALRRADLSSESLTEIGVRAFYNCYNLTSVTLPDGIESIGEAVFYSCIRLAELDIPRSVSEIGRLAFYNCSSRFTLTVRVGSAGHVYAKENGHKYTLTDYTAGDVDGDGTLTNSDITLAIRAASGWDVGYGADTADLNLDGRISNRELITIIISLPPATEAE